MFSTIVYIIWISSEILLNRFLRAEKSDKQDADKNSLSLIWITILVAMSIAIFVYLKFHMPIFNSSKTEFIGLTIIITGIIFRFTAIISLGRFFTVNLTIREGHKLKKNGIYTYIRHPSYLGSLISFIGFSIVLNNWLSLSIITILILGSFINRIKIEEEILIEQFGQEYLDYMKKTYRIIPFIF